MTHDNRLTLLRSELASAANPTLRRTAGMREAGVAVLIRPRAELDLLLIKRAERESDPWSGHMALPGGLRSATDPDIVTTALRETLEEVAISVDPARDLIGRLPEVAPASPVLPSIVISPVVAVVAPDTEATPDPREVDAAVWVPLDALRDERAVSEILIELKEDTRAFPSLRYGDYVIWGLTHRILDDLVRVLDAAGI